MRGCAPEAAAAPELVEVWRPGGRSEERRPRHDRNRHRHHDRPAEGAPSAAVAGEPGDAAKGERHRRGRRDRHNEFRKLRADAPAGAAPAAAADGAPAGAPREDKAVRRASVFRAGTRAATTTRAGIATRIAASSAAGATRAAATKAAAIATRAATAGRRTGNMPPAPRRASAIVRSIPIRRLPNWRRSRNSSPPTARTDQKRFQAKWVPVRVKKTRQR